MGQESSQVQQIEEDPSSMDDNSSTRGGVEGDYPLPTLPPSRDAREERSSSSPQRRRKMGNGISEDGAGDQSDSARRADKKLKKQLKKKNKNRIGGKDEGKDTEITSSLKQKKKKNRTSGGVSLQSEERRTSQSGPLHNLQAIGRSAAAVLLPRSDTVERVPESSHPTADAPSSSMAAKKKKKKSKAKRQSLQAAVAGNGGDGGGSGTCPTAADAEPLGKEKLPPTPTSSWAAVNVPPSATTAEKTTHDDVNMTNGQTKHKDAEEATAEETESNSPAEQTDVNATKPKSSQARPVEDEMDLDPIQSQNTPAIPVADEMDLVVVEPQNAEAGPTGDSEDQLQERLEVANTEVPQIGVYAAGEEPTSTTRRRKRRLPVDDDPVETPSKKTKRALKAKSPVTKGQKTKAAAKAPGSSSAPRTPTRAVAADDGKQVGRMTDEDLAVIKNQLLKYREMNDITEEQQNRLIHSGAKEHNDLFNLVCEEFPDRKRWSIIKFCRRKFHNFPARGKWSPEDDEDLKDACRQMPTRWTEIGKRLNRHPEDCRDRWRNYLICGDNMITVYWDDAEEQKLRKAVAECVSYIQELKQKGMIPGEDSDDDVKLVDWQMVSEKMHRTRSRLQCREKWRRMHEREDTDKVDTPLREGAAWREKLARKETQHMDLDDKLVILRSIKESQVTREGKINWKKIGDEEFQRRYAMRPLKVAFMKLKGTVPNAKSYMLQEIVDILLEKLENANGQDPTEDTFRDGTGIRKARNKHISEEIIRSEDEESDGDAEDQIRQELPKLKNTSRSAEKKKLSDRMARDSESVDSLGYAIPSGGPEVPESEYEDEPAVPKTNGTHKSAKSDSNSDSDDSDLDEEIPARRTSISL